MCKENDGGSDSTPAEEASLESGELSPLDIFLLDKVRGPANMRCLESPGLSALKHEMNERYPFLVGRLIIFMYQARDAKSRVGEHFTVADLLLLIFHPNSNAPNPRADLDQDRYPNIRDYAAHLLFRIRGCANVEFGRRVIAFCLPPGEIDVNHPVVLQAMELAEI